MEMTLKSTNKQAAVASKAVGKPRRRVMDRGVAAPVVQKPAAAVAMVEKKSPVAAETGPVGVRRGRSNRRSEQTIANILMVTEDIVLKSGAERISILDVCREAGISRGTFYRYFASQDELLDAFARHKREQFHVTLAEAVQPYQDPDERFDALIRYLDHYLEHGRARRLLVVAPEYALGFFRRIFHD